MLRKFQNFIDMCSKSSVLDKVLTVTTPTYLSWLPKPTMKAYSTVGELGLQSVQSLGSIMVTMDFEWTETIFF